MYNYLQDERCQVAIKNPDQKLVPFLACSLLLFSRRLRTGLKTNIEKKRTEQSQATTSVHQPRQLYNRRTDLLSVHITPAEKGERGYRVHLRTVRAECFLEKQGYEEIKTGAFLIRNWIEPSGLFRLAN
jgi:hypothetical protein